VAPATLAPAESTPSTVATPSTAETAVASTTVPLPNTTLLPLTGFELTEIADVSVPVGFAAAPGSDTLFVIDKTGLIHAIDAGGATSEYLDLRGEVSDGFEQGLLGLAFAPDFESSGRLYVSYTDRSGATVIEEFLDEDGTPAQSETLFRAAQPAGNHNGGSMLFDERGLLYVGLGDGGGANDRYRNGQNTDTPLGAILRFDLAQPDLIPAANPFAGGGGAPEIWATGLRNPWRLSIDEGVMIVPDVGQNAYEEISLVPLNEPGPNLGWPRFEGLHCFDTSLGCDDEGLVIPVVEIPHGDAGSCSITGGFVYRGEAIPEWQGRYFYSDYCGGYLRSVTFVDGAATDHIDWTQQIGGSVGNVLAVGAAPSGELLIGVGDGRVLRVDPIR
jgi:glucose/arabinose dehydrogenase